MKYSKLLYLLAFSLLFPLFSCEDDVERTETFMANVPVYMSYSEFRQEKSISKSQEMIQPGKICMYGNYLFINEISKGIHIINNSNPKNPENIGFLEIIGNIDMAIKDNLLFVDSQSDLVCFDISNPEKPTEKSRSKDVFYYVFPSTGNNYPIDDVDPEKGVVIDWVVQKITKKVERNRPMPCYDFASDLSSSWSSYNKSSKATAITGSMARFAVNGDYLYVIENNYLLKVFSISDNKASLIKSEYARSTVETLFCYKENLFMGGPSGLCIYSIEDPQSPKYLSFITHIVGCDPVVVQDDYAYVTVRSGNFCGQNANELMVIDVKEPSNPQIKATFTMQEPYGLSIDGNHLFVCDNGIKIFDVSNPLEAGKKQLAAFDNMHGFDVIAYGNLLMMIGNDGLSQYDYSDINNVHLLSTISVNK